MSEENYMMQQRRKLHEVINEIVRLDPDYSRTHGFVKGWVLVVDLTGLNPDEEDVVSEARGQPWADLGLYCSDATGETDLSPHSGEGLLRYAAAHYEDIYDTMAASEDEEGDD